MNLIITLLFNFPYIGLVYLATMIIAGGFSLYGMYSIISFPFAIKILQVGLKMYIACAIITMFIMTTFSYLHCCVGLQTFTNHLRHSGMRHLTHALEALLWPLSWLGIHQQLMCWGICWLDVILQVIEYWFITRWKGTTFEFFDFEKGTVTSTRVAPEDSQEALINAIKECSK